MRAGVGVILCAVVMLAGCAGDKPQVGTDLTVALDVAATVEGAYAARPGSDPKTVAELARLLAVAQAAVASWNASSLPADQALAGAAISALVEFEATAGATP